MASRQLPSRYDSERVRGGVPAYYKIPNGDELKAMREGVGMRQQDVADHTSLSLQTVSRVERETQDPKAETLSELLQLYREEWDTEVIV